MNDIVNRIGAAQLEELSEMKDCVLSPLTASPSTEGAVSCRDALKDIRDIAGIITRKGKVLWLFPSEKRTAEALEGMAGRLEKACADMRRGLAGIVEDEKYLTDDMDRFSAVAKGLAEAVKGAGMVLEEAEKKGFVEVAEEARERIVTLQQALIVAQQGAATMAVIIKNNRILALGLERALAVTVPAVAVASVIRESGKTARDVVGEIARSAGAAIKEDEDPR